MSEKYRSISDLLEVLETTYSITQSKLKKGILVISELYLDDYAFNLKMSKTFFQLSYVSLGLSYGSLPGNMYPPMFYRSIEDIDYFQISENKGKIQISFNWNESYLAVEF
jgi:hypothetical protein